MSQTIDSKVVEMRFDNKQFESNIQTSMKSIDKLQNSLKFDGATKGLDNIKNASSKLNFSGLSDSIGSIGQKFSAFETIATGVLFRIGQKVADAGIQLVKSLSVDNISAGWEKFGDKTQSVATLVSQGYSMEEVNKELERLNWYTDETSYDFTSMVQNIAKFTATGKNLNESVDAMQGIANWAALSGQNAQTASHAMYQLSQAMGAGAMRLEDYKSIQNVSMDTDEFRQKALDAAVALGTLEKNADGTYSSLISGAKDAFNFTKSEFATTLTGGKWLTSDVMMEVFKQYGAAVDQVYQYAEEKGITASEAMEQLGDKVDEFGLKAFKAAQEARTFPDVLDSVKDAVSTGWMKTFELIFGNYEEAKVLWTDLANELYDLFAESGNARNEMLKIWHDDGGRDAFINSLWNTFHAITDIVDVVKQAFSEMFPPMTAKRLISLTKSLENLTKKFKMSEETSDKLKRTFKGIIAVAEIMFQIFKAIGHGIKLMLDPLLKADKGILDLTSSIGDWLVNLDKWLKKNQILTKAVEKYVKIIQSIPGIINDAFEKITGKSIGEAFDLIKTKAVEAKDKLRDLTGGLDNVVNKIIAIPMAIKKFFSKGDIDTSNIANPMEKAFAEIANMSPFEKFLDNIKTRISDTILSVDSAIEGFTGVSILKVLGKIKEKAESAGKAVKDFFAGFKKVDTSGVGEVSEDVEKKLSPLEKVLNKIKAIFETLEKIAKKVFGVIKKIVSTIGGILKKIGKQLYDTFDLESIGINDITDIMNSGALIAIALGLKKFIDNFADIGEKAGGVVDSVNNTVKSIGGIANNISGVLNSVKDSLEDYQNNLKAKTLMSIAIAVGILTASIVVLASIKPEKLSSALSALTAELTSLMASMSYMTSQFDGKKLGSITKATTAMILMSVAVLILSTAVKKLSDIDPEKIGVGLSAVTTMIAMLTLSAKALSDDSKKMMKGAAGLILFAVAVRLLVKPIKELGNVDTTTLAKGLSMVTYLIASLVVVAKALSKDVKSFIRVSASLLIFSIAIRALVKPVEELGALDTKTLSKGLIGVSTLIAGIAAFLKFTDLDGMSMTKGVGLLLMAESIKVIANAVDIMGSMDTKKIIMGLTGLSAVLVGVSLFMQTLDGVDDIGSKATGILIISGAMLIFSKAVEKLGSMDVQTLAKGLIGMGVALAAVAAALHLMPDTSVSTAVGLVIVASALTIISKAVGNMGSMAIADLAKGLGALVIVLAALAVALNAMQGTLGASASLMITAIALNALGVALTLISAIPAKKLAKGLIGLGAALGVIIVAGMAAQTVAPGLLALGAAVALVGVGALAAGVGVLALSTGLAELAVTGPAGIAILLSAFEQWILTIPKFAKAVGEAIVIIVKVIIEALPGILNDLRDTLKQLLAVINELIPGIIDTVINLIDQLLATLAEHFPSIISSVISMLLELLKAIASKIDEIAATGLKIVEGLLRGIAEGLPKIIDAAFDVIIAFITGLGDAMVSHAAELRDAIKKFVMSIVTAIKEFLGINSPSTVFIEIAKNMIFGLVNGVIEFSKMIIDEFIALMSNIIKEIKKFFTKFVNFGKNVITKIIEGVTDAARFLYQKVASVISTVVSNIKKKLSSFFTKGKDIISSIVSGIGEVASDLWDALTGDDGVISKAIDGIKDIIGSFVEIGKNIIQGIVDGIKAAPGKIIDAILEVCGPLADVVKEVFDIESPSKVMMEIGEYITEGLAIGIADKGDMATAAITNVSDNVIDGLGGLSSKIADIINADTDFNPTITPVVDLSNVSASSAAIDSMLNADRTLALAGNANMQMNGKISADVSNKKLNVDNSDVVNELKSLRNDMNTMTETLTQMSIIMDTGALVGSLSRPMDSALGRRATLRRRGV